MVFSILKSMSLAVVEFLVILVAGFVLSIVFIFTIGLQGAMGWHIILLLSFIIIVGTIVLIRKVQPSSGLLTKSIIQFAIYLTILELLIVIVAPMNSMIPPASLMAIGIISNAEGSCDIASKITQADSFYRGVLDYKRIKIISGGIPGNFGSPGAMVIENTIHVKQPPYCLSEETLIHESMHIWQFQTGWWYGLSGPVRLGSWLYQQSADPSGLYDHGGPSALANARASGSSITDFGPEQQAVILQDYYRSSKGQATDSAGRTFDPSYKNDLQYFTLQVTGP